MDQQHYTWGLLSSSTTGDKLYAVAAGPELFPFYTSDNEEDVKKLCDRLNGILNERDNGLITEYQTQITKLQKFKDETQEVIGEWYTDAKQLKDRFGVKRLLKVINLFKENSLKIGDEFEKLAEERFELLVDNTQLQEAINQALDSAVSAIYFTDSSDYLPALYQVVRKLDLNLCEVLEENPSLAFKQIQARIDSPLLDEDEETLEMAAQ